MLAKANYEAKVIPYNAYCNIKKVISSSKFNTNILQDNIEFSGIITLNILNEIKKNLIKIIYLIFIMVFQVKMQ